MPRVMARAETSCAHHAACACRQVSRPNYTWHARKYLWMCHSHKLDYIYQNQPLHILTPKIRKSQTRTCWKGSSLPCSTRTQLFQMRISGYDQMNPHRPCTTGRLHLASWGRVTSKISLVLVHFGLIKIKPKQNTSVFPTYFTC